MIAPNVGFHSKKDEYPTMVDNIFVFSCAKPSIVQSKEIKRVPTDVTLEIEPGYILTIFTDAGMAEKASQVFPGPYVLDSTAPKKILEIPIQNQAGSPLHIMEGQVIAKGYLTQVAEVQIKEIEPVASGRQKMKRTQPQKKNTDIKFEVK
jgi:dUTPase